MESTWTKRAVLASVMGLALAASAIAAEPVQQSADVQTELQALKARIAELEKKEDEGWLNTQRTEQIKSIVEDVMRDARTRGQFLDGDVTTGYNKDSGFFLQTADKQNKLIIGGFIQFRYEYTNNNIQGHKSVSEIKGSDPANSSGFELRRARFSLSGNVITEDLTFKLEGDFGGANSNAADFQVTDAYMAYRPFHGNPWINMRAGSFKLPFAKAELTSDTVIGVDERTEVLVPFDPVRGVGVSLFGNNPDNNLSYDVNVSDGGGTNLVGRADDTAGAHDNRLAFYGRVQFAGSGKMPDFTEEPDYNQHDHFVWLIGGAGGYESANSTTTAFPAVQSLLTIPALSTLGSPASDFVAPARLNGDLYRATVDWTGKYEGWSFLTAGYFQQINVNPPTDGGLLTPTTTTGAVTKGATSIATSVGKSSIFQYGYYGQVGYFLEKKRWEVVGRAGQIATEGRPNTSESFTLGLNYYLYGHNAKVMTDVTYIPDAAFTSTTADTIRNTQDLIARVQLQIKF